MKTKCECLYKTPVSFTGLWSLDCMIGKRSLFFTSPESTVFLPTVCKCDLFSSSLSPFPTACCLTFYSETGSYSLITGWPWTWGNLLTLVPEITGISQLTCLALCICVLQFLKIGYLHILKVGFFFFYLKKFLQTSLVGWKVRTFFFLSLQVGCHCWLVPLLYRSFLVWNNLTGLLLL